MAYAQEGHRDVYWNNVGLLEECIKKGYNAGMISGSDAKRIIRMVDSQPDDLFLCRGNGSS